MSPILIEACVDSVESASAAQAGGAGRVELCDNLIEGGTTPSAGTIELARKQLSIGLAVLIRPRGGDFLYSELEYDVMRQDVTVAKDLGADVLVVGGLTREGRVDVDGVGRLLEAAHPLPVTFHRAFDVARDPAEALEALIGMGVRRVLTSGQEATALAGIRTLARLVRQAAGRIGILAGGSVDETNIAQIVRDTGVQEVHVRGTRPLTTAMMHRNPRVSMGKAFTPDDSTRMVTDPARLRAMAAALATPQSRA